MAQVAAVQSQLNFFDTIWEESGKYHWTIENQTFRPTNLTSPDTHNVTIRDLRGYSADQLGQLGLDFERAGFHVEHGWGLGGEVMANAWASRAWKDEKWIQDVYYPYVIDLLKKSLFPNAKVVIFDHTVRQRAKLDVDQVPPAEQTHIDQTNWAALERIRMHQGQEAYDRVQSGQARAIICNVWRPLIGPALDRPLAVADRRTILDERDLDMTLPAPPGCRTGESQMVRYHPDQEWYYVSKMQPDECLFLKIFDSKTGVGSPHSAFYDSSAPADAPPRWSIENTYNAALAPRDRKFGNFLTPECTNCVTLWRHNNDYPEIILDAWRHATFGDWNLSYDLLTGAYSREMVREQFAEDQESALSIVDNSRQTPDDPEFEEEDSPDHDDDCAIDPRLLCDIRDASGGLESESALPDNIVEHQGSLVYMGDEYLTDSEDEDCMEYEPTQ